MCRAAAARRSASPGLCWAAASAASPRRYGTAAASLLEAEIVTADGKTRIVNAAQEPDLFWALKGGGGGTFGVVTRLTLATHELPENLRRGEASTSRPAPTRPTAGFSPALSTFMRRTCSIRTGASRRSRGPDNRLQIQMVFQGLTQDRGARRLANR